MAKVVLDLDGSLFNYFFKGIYGYDYVGKNGVLSSDSTVIKMCSNDEHYYKDCTYFMSVFPIKGLYFDNFTIVKIKILAIEGNEPIIAELLSQIVQPNVVIYYGFEWAGTKNGDMQMIKITKKPINFNSIIEMIYPKVISETDQEIEKLKEENAKLRKIIENIKGVLTE